MSSSYFFDRARSLERIESRFRSHLHMIHAKVNSAVVLIDQLHQLDAEGIFSTPGSDIQESSNKQQHGLSLIPQLFTPSSELPSSAPSERYCLCSGSAYGRMIACDQCDEWFHLKCVNLKSTRKGRWECPRCR